MSEAITRESVRRDREDIPRAAYMQTRIRIRPGIPFAKESRMGGGEGGRGEEIFCKRWRSKRGKCRLNPAWNEIKFYGLRETRRTY